MYIIWRWRERLVLNGYKKKEKIIIKKNLYIKKYSIYNIIIFNKDKKKKPLIICLNYRLWGRNTGTSETLDGDRFRKRGVQFTCQKRDNNGWCPVSVSSEPRTDGWEQTD